MSIKLSLPAQDPPWLPTTSVRSTLLSVDLSVLYSETPVPSASCVLPFTHSPKPNLPSLDPQAGQALCCLKAIAHTPPSLQCPSL